MADKNLKQLEIDYEQIEALHALDAESVTFPEAQNILNTTEADVTTALANHDDLFKTAKENIKESLPEGNDRDRKAFVLAFKRVYGKFKIENEKLSIYDENLFLEKLNAVLGKKLGDKLDIKKLKEEHPELYASYFRLAELENAGYLNKNDDRIVYEDYPKIVEEIIKNKSNPEFAAVLHLAQEFEEDFRFLEVIPDYKALLPLKDSNYTEFLKRLFALKEFQDFLTISANPLKVELEKLPKEYNPKAQGANFNDIVNKAFASESAVDIKEKEANIGKLKKKKEVLKVAQGYFGEDSLDNANSGFDKLEKSKWTYVSNPLIPKYNDVKNIQLGAKIAELQIYVKQSETPRVKEETDNAYTSRMNNGKNAGALVSELQGYLTKAEEVHAEMLKLANTLDSLIKVDYITATLNQKDAISKIKNIKNIAKTPNFTLNDLLSSFKIIKALVDPNLAKLTNSKEYSKEIVKAEEDVETQEKALTKDKKSASENAKLSDSAASKKLYLSIIKKLYPTLSEEQQKNMATLSLTEDLARIENARSYEQLAREGSVELKGALDEAAFSTLLKFQFKVGDKLVNPFKGMSLKDLDDWDKIEKQFGTTGKFDMQTGFFLLAGMKKVGKKTEGNKEEASLNSIAYIKLEKKLKELIAKELGVSLRMDEGPIVKAVNLAFAEQLKKSDELVTGFFDHFEKDKGKRNEKMVESLQHRKKILDHQRSLGELTDEEYEEEYEEIVDDAKEAGVLKELGFLESAFFSDYFNDSRSSWLKDKANSALIGAASAFNSPAAAWIGDKARSASKYALGRASAAATGTLYTGLKAIWGTAGLALRTGLGAVESIKYPLTFIAKPFIGTYKKITTGKWETPSLIKMARNDIGRVYGYSGKKLGGIGGSIKDAYSSTWSAKFFDLKSEPYEKRVKVDKKHLEGRVKKLTEKGLLTPIEIASAPSLDKDKYIKLIQKYDPNFSASAEKHKKEEEKHDEHKDEHKKDEHEKKADAA